MELRNTIFNVWIVTTIITCEGLFFSSHLRNVNYTINISKPYAASFAINEPLLIQSSVWEIGRSINLHVFRY